MHLHISTEGACRAEELNLLRQRQSEYSNRNESSSGHLATVLKVLTVIVGLFLAFAAVAVMEAEVALIAIALIAVGTGAIFLGTDKIILIFPRSVQYWGIPRSRRPEYVFVPNPSTQSSRSSPRRPASRGNTAFGGGHTSNTATAQPPCQQQQSGGRNTAFGGGHTSNTATAQPSRQQQQSGGRNTAFGGGHASNTATAQPSRQQQQSSGRNAAFGSRG